MLLPPVAFSCRHRRGEGDNSGIDRRGKSGQFISSTFRVGRDVVDAGVYVDNFEDFCGGYAVYSPFSNVCSAEGWGSMLPGHRRNPDPGPAVPIFDATEMYAESDLSMRDFGYRTVAAGLASLMLSWNKLAVVSSGAAEGGEVAAFSEQFANLTHTGGARIRFPAELPWVFDRTPIYETGSSTITTTTECSQSWLNPNSGNDVAWFMMRITGASSYWESDPDDEYWDGDDDIDAEYAIERAADADALDRYYGDLDVWARVKAHGSIVPEIILRQQWRNG